MKHIITASATIFIFGTALFIHDRSRRSSPPETQSPQDEVVRIANLASTSVRAAGRIEGRSEEIELRARMNEQISNIHVRHGQYVSAGDVLVSLDSDRLVSERDLAAALRADPQAHREAATYGCWVEHLSDHLADHLAEAEAEVEA